MNLEVYLYFKGNCREAMEFYKSVFGGELKLTTYADSKVPAPEGMNDEALMHAVLEGGDIKLMASDTAKASPQTKKVSLSLGGTDEAKMRKVFGKLSAGGNIFQPLDKAPWGDLFGSFTDKFGVDWMMNIGLGADNV